MSPACLDCADLGRRCDTCEMAENRQRRRELGASRAANFRARKRLAQSSPFIQRLNALGVKRAKGGPQ